MRLFCPEESMDDYKVDLEIFRGPLDLLLHLVKKNEVDIFDIPIATITDQYLGYLDLLRLIDIDVAADFLVTASALMEIKSRMLLPRPELLDGEEGEEEDPRMELVRQLLEYKRFKDAAGVLEDRAKAQADFFQRLTNDRPPEESRTEDQIVDGVELWDLVEAFGRLMRATQSTAQNIVYDDTPVSTYMDRLLARMEELVEATFAALFENTLEDRGAIIGTFLALLELMKLGRLHCEQHETHGEIVIRLGPAPAPKLPPEPVPKPPAPVEAAPPPVAVVEPDDRAPTEELLQMVGPPPPDDAESTDTPNVDESPALVAGQPESAPDVQTAADADPAPRDSVAQAEASVVQPEPDAQTPAEDLLQIAEPPAPDEIEAADTEPGPRDWVVEAAPAAAVRVEPDDRTTAEGLGEPAELPEQDEAEEVEEHEADEPLEPAPAVDQREPSPPMTSARYVLEAPPVAIRPPPVRMAPSLDRQLGVPTARERSVRIELVAPEVGAAPPVIESPPEPVTRPTRRPLQPVVAPIIEPGLAATVRPVAPLAAAEPLPAATPIAQARALPPAEAVPLADFLSQADGQTRD